MQLTDDDWQELHAIRAYSNQFHADLLDTNKLNQARHDLFALVRR